MKRCWGDGNEYFQRYHDNEWGVPVHNDRKLFEMLSLEGAQAGLSWLTVLKKRAGYKKVFRNFDFNKVAKFTQKDIARLLKDAEIIRNRLKIKSVVNNARAMIEVRKEFGTFSRYLWGFVQDKPIINRFKSIREVPAKTALSDKISKDLKKRSFRFCGSTIVYSFMQAVGIVNDHAIGCPRFPKGLK